VLDFHLIPINNTTRLHVKLVYFSPAIFTCEISSEEKDGQG